ncbi:GNAT family N-acetyltransferase [Rhodococcus sp. NPDC060176]|uniref:GNAT family N-acetyltransferase n=1 Tax=Rhodococcus sp. NPDC060176 TaxID=3347062 RepID=UPI0036492D3C
MKVTTTTLEMLAAPTRVARPLPDDARLDRPATVSPEYARFLYGLVGGPWYWTERLCWSQQQWADDLAVVGTEFLILYGEGAPLGYVHLQPIPIDDGIQVEIRYFGLVEQAIGRGLGSLLLEHGIDAAWSLSARHDLPVVTRVWVHTCTLDGPAALANYQARGLVICGVADTDEPMPAQPLGSWASTGGPTER